MHSSFKTDSLSPIHHLSHIYLKCIRDSNRQLAPPIIVLRTLRTTSQPPKESWYRVFRMHFGFRNRQRPTHPSSFTHRLKCNRDSNRSLALPIIILLTLRTAPSLSKESWYCSRCIRVSKQTVCHPFVSLYYALSEMHSRLKQTACATHHRPSQHPTQYQPSVRFEREFHLTTKRLTHRQTEVWIVVILSTRHCNTHWSYTDSFTHQKYRTHFQIDTPVFNTVNSTSQISLD